MVGREEEREVLRECWAHAKAGVGQAVLLHGEAGIGKSRLVQALKEQVVQEGAMSVEFRCSPYTQHSALSPLIDYLQRLLRFRRDESPQAKATKLAEMLASYRFSQTDTVALLSTLLSLPYPEKTPPLTLSPQKQKQKTYEVLAAWLKEEAERGPVYCVWEDLHWADPSTLEVFSLLLEQLPAMPWLMVFTCRPEFRPPWKAESGDCLPHAEPVRALSGNRADAESGWWESVARGSRSANRDQDRWGAVVCRRTDENGGRVEPADRMRDSL